MSKRKTRQEKIIADLRRKLQTTHLTSSSTSMSLPSKPNREIYTVLPQKKSLVVFEKLYILTDLRKTAIVTLSIIVFEMILYFLLQKHIISLANLRF